MATTTIPADVKKIVSKRLGDSRMRVIFSAPFYGSLLLHLKFAFASCKTAATDMKKVMFDPEFVTKLSDEELDFVLKHEIMHCVLQHPIRGKGKHQFFYNVASDIVVNSNILQSLGYDSFKVAGQEVMHLAPNGKEGYLYSADEVYKMLIDKHEGLIKDVYELQAEIADKYGVVFDSHDIWGSIPLEESLSEEWKGYLKQAAKACGDSSGFPMGPRELLDDFNGQGRLNWREVLADFIHFVSDKHDYLFTPPDKRFYSTSDLMLPSFVEVDGEEVDNIWFVVDTSGSICEEELNGCFNEIKAAVGQIDHLSGMVSFFDTEVTDPVAFDSLETLNTLSALGGGGTSFSAIFDYMKANMVDNLPTAVVILTDGYSSFPDESATLGVPILWVLTEEGVVPPFGTTVKLDW